MPTLTTPNLYPCLWFDTEAEAAAELYARLIPDSIIEHIVRYDAAAAAATGRPEGLALTVKFKLAGHAMLALNGGPQYPHSPAVSMVLSCQTQAEIDHYWVGLSAYPEHEQCGWLKDRFGLSWQVVPAKLSELLQGPNGAKVMQALLQMKKLDLAALEAAHRG